MIDDIFITQLLQQNSNFTKWKPRRKLKKRIIFLIVLSLHNIIDYFKEQ
jgi:hypothetical protein